MRIGSNIARDGGWMAKDVLILGLETPAEMVCERELLICRLQTERIGNKTEEDISHVRSHAFAEI